MIPSKFPRSEVRGASFSPAEPMTSHSFRARRADDLDAGAAEEVWS
jgi:hypothetical protein